MLCQSEASMSDNARPIWPLVIKMPTDEYQLQLSSQKRGRRHSQSASETSVSPAKDVIRNNSVRSILDRFAEPRERSQDFSTKADFAIPSITIYKSPTSPREQSPKSAPVLLDQTRGSNLGRRLSNLRPGGLRREASGGLGEHCSDGSSSPKLSPTASPFRTPITSKGSVALKSPLSTTPISVGRRLSSLLKREKSFSSEESRQPSVIALDELLNARENRNSLVEKLLAAHHRDASLSIRFISGVNEIRRSTETKENNKMRAKKLVSLFLAPTSAYSFKEFQIPKDLVAAASQGGQEGLLHLKEFFLEELCKIDIVLAYIEEMKPIE